MFSFLFDLMSEFFLLESGGREKKVINVSKQTNKKKSQQKMFLPLTFTLVSLQEGGRERPQSVCEI